MCAVFHRLLGLGSNLHAFHSGPPMAASSSAALNLSFACPILRNELYLLTLPPHRSHWTLLLNRAEISRKAATLVPQMSFGFSLFVSHYAPVSFPCDSRASSYNRDGNSDIYVENRDFPSTSAWNHWILVTMLWDQNSSTKVTVLAS